MKNTIKIARMVIAVAIAVAVSGCSKGDNFNPDVAQGVVTPQQVAEQERAYAEQLQREAAQRARTAAGASQ